MRERERENNSKTKKAIKYSEIDLKREKEIMNKQTDQ